MNLYEFLHISSQIPSKSHTQTPSICLPLLPFHLYAHPTCEVLPEVDDVHPRLPDANIQMLKLIQLTDIYGHVVIAQGLGSN